MKTQITPAEFQASIDRFKATANYSADVKPYVSKLERAPYKHDVSALAASIERGKGLVA